MTHDTKFHARSTLRVVSERANETQTHSLNHTSSPHQDRPVTELSAEWIAMGLAPRHLHTSAAAAAAAASIYSILKERLLLLPTQDIYVGADRDGRL